MSENRCVTCGEIIPEGKQVCPKCKESVRIYGVRVTYKYGWTRFFHGNLKDVVQWADKELTNEDVNTVNIWRVGK